ncbi:PorP/SprF family type IX secretion system membrane protein [Joostella sp. CR20]|uniref:PorP/SprF family type IX secretion system membrane protein n=1 Tax=Joostella sp. CR20 TaxID=2804312 RepID=UPI00313C1F08
MKLRLLYILLLCTTCLFAQEDVPVASIDIPAQNLLKFNRFLINPTFSTVNEDYSYFNFYHRNQWVSFDDNFQTYLGSYSGRISDRSGLGLSVYHQRFGTISNFGVMSNYAYGIRLSEKSNLTFGFNLSYYNSGVDRSNINPSQPDDPTIADLQDGSLISFQPGINLSIGSFDVGIYAENAFDYNFKTNEPVTDFQDKTFTGHLMYTNRFKNGVGMMQDAKLTALTRARRVGDEDVNLSGSLILDMPKLGWVQAGYDDYYGIAAGLGFNITKRLSLGYTIEKGLSNETSNFGVTHEINFAYAFQPTLSENRVYEDLEEDENLLLVETESPQDTITDKDAEIARLRKLVAENNMIIDEMMFKQDSMEEARKNDINKRFAYIIKYVNDNKGKGNEAEVKERAVAMMKAIDEDAYATAQTKYNNEYNNLGSANRTANSKTVSVNKTKASPKPVSNSSVSSGNSLTTPTTTTNLANVASGAYVIANVYQNEKYMHTFIDDLESKGIDADYFTKGRLKYVYIKKYNTVAEATNAQKSQFNGTYTDEVWVMNVESTTSDDATQTTTAVASNDENEKPSGSTSNSKQVAIPTENETTAGVISEIQYINGLSECTDRYVTRIFHSDELGYSNEVLVNDEQESKDVPSEEKGYYVIANVFSEEKNATKYVDQLKAEGIDADIFINPKNNYNYVYLNKSTDWNTALQWYKKSINYKNDIWIMPMKNT